MSEQETEVCGKASDPLPGEKPPIDETSIPPLVRMFARAIVDAVQEKLGDLLKGESPDDSA